MEQAKISAYLTVRNGVELDYPFEAAIRSCFSFADEIVVADSSDKDDGTMDILEKLMDEDERVQVYHVDVPWDAPNYGIYDGQMKAYAREQCTGDFLWQMDADEVAEPKTKEKLEMILPQVHFLKEIPLMSFPVVEYWGGQERVRIDVNSWKWRISRKDANLTHGIPASHRWYKDGLLYARPGTDGCDYLDKNANTVPCVHFINQQSEKLRMMALNDLAAALKYQEWYQNVVDNLPTVHHFSWWSIASKIKKYKLFWNNSWLTLYCEKQTKPKVWNPFFENKSLDEVTEEEIVTKAKELAEGCGGWVFHKPWDGTRTNSVKLNTPIPEIIKKWTDEHTDQK